MSSFFFPFVTANVPKSELARALFGQKTEKTLELKKFRIIGV